MEHREAEDWRVALEVAKLAPNTGMVPMRCATALAVDAELAMLREWVEDLKRERLVLQKISARRANALEWAGLHADCTMDQARSVADERERLRQALAKIADWHGAWGPYPENSEGWRAMAVVTAREAVPELGPNARLTVPKRPPQE